MSERSPEEQTENQTLENPQAESREIGHATNVKKIRFRLYAALAAALTIGTLGYGQVMNHLHNQTLPTQDQIDGEFDSFIDSPEEVLEKIKREKQKEKDNSGGGGYIGDSAMG